MTGGEDDLRSRSDTLETGLSSCRIGASVLCFDQVDSTNDVAWGSMKGGPCDGLVVLAETQRAGRGRQGRRWESPAGENLLMSVLLEDPHRRLAPEAVTIAAGLAVAQGVEDAASLRCDLKWPNDVLLDGAKLAGVLVEARSVEGRWAMVIGIGVNVRSTPPGSVLARPAVCLADRLEAPPSRTSLARAVLLHLDHWIDEIHRARLDDLHEQWTRRCGMIGQRATISTAGVHHSGHIADVTPLEGIELITDDGIRVHLPSATSTVL